MVTSALKAATIVLVGLLTAIGPAEAISAGAAGTATTSGGPPHCCP